MSIFVVLDQYGFIGGYNSMDNARALLDEYKDIPMIIKEYNTNTDVIGKEIWFLPMGEIGGPPLEVSYDIEYIKNKQIYYDTVGMSIVDDIDYFKRNINELGEFEHYRLNIEIPKPASPLNEESQALPSTVPDESYKSLEQEEQEPVPEEPVPEDPPEE